MLLERKLLHGDQRMRASLVCNLVAMAMGLVGGLFIIAAGIVVRSLPSIIKAATNSTMI